MRCSCRPYSRRSCSRSRDNLSREVKFHVRAETTLHRSNSPYARGCARTSRIHPTPSQARSRRTETGFRTDGSNRWQTRRPRMGTCRHHPRSKRSTGATPPQGCRGQRTDTEHQQAGGLGHPDARRVREGEVYHVNALVRIVRDQCQRGNRVGVDETDVNGRPRGGGGDGRDLDAVDADGDRIAACICAELKPDAVCSRRECDRARLGIEFEVGYTVP